jgi:hypothetical protein
LKQKAKLLIEQNIVLKEIKILINFLGGTAKTPKERNFWEFCEIAFRKNIGINKQ